MDVEWLETLEARRILYRIPWFSSCRNSSLSFAGFGGYRNILPKGVGKELAM